MFNFKPTPKANKPDSFQLNRGLDSVNSPNFLAKGKVTKALNILFTDNGWKKRPGITLYGQTGNSNVNAEGVILSESGDIRVRCYGTKFQKYVTNSWVDVGGVTMTDIPTTIVSFIDANLTASALRSGGTTSATQRTFVPNVAGMTINQYGAKIIRLLTGTGAGQEKLIAGNDGTTIFIEGLWDTTPDATTTYDIRDVSPHVFVTNGTDTVFKYDGTTVTTFPNMTKWTSLEVAHNRMFGARRDLDNIYFSGLGCSYFSGQAFIPINPDGDQIIQIQKNLEEVIIYKRNSRYRLTGYDEEQFQLITADRYVGCIAPKSVVHGNNYNFFLGHKGVYSINTLENSTVDEGLPISRDINNKIFDTSPAYGHTQQQLENSVGWISENRYYLAIGPDVYIYDILQSAMGRTQVWSEAQYGVSVQSALVNNGTIYLGAKESYTVGGLTDNGTSIPVEVITGRRVQGDNDRFKIYRRQYASFNSANTDATATISYSIDGINWILGSQQNLANALWSVGIMVWSFVSPWTFIRQTDRLNMSFNIGKMSKFIMYKYEISGDGDLEFLVHDNYYELTSKIT